MSLHQDGSAGSLIYAAGLHADHAVLHDVHNADAVLAAETVQLADDVGHLHLLAVDRGGNTLLKGHGHILGLVRSFLRGNAQNEKMIVVGLVCRILQLQSLMADVPQVPVAAVGLIRGEGQVNAVRLAVFNLGFTGIHGPLVVTPWGDDLQVGSQSLDAQLETDLVISLAGCAVADSDCAFLAGNLNQLLRDAGACHGSSQKIFVLVDGARLYTGNDIVVAELVRNILNI